MSEKPENLGDRRWPGYERLPIFPVWRPGPYVRGKPHRVWGRSRQEEKKYRGGWKTGGRAKPVQVQGKKKKDAPGRGSVELKGFE